MNSVGKVRVDTSPSKPTINQLFSVFAKIGLLSFGGPAAQISLMHFYIVNEKAWLTEKQYLNALSFCMLLPGPEAMQLATYAGWRIHGLVGGLIGGLLFVLPGAAIVLALATVYAVYGDVPMVTALFLGIKAAVLIVVIEALLRVSKKALKGRVYWLIAGLAYIGIFFFSIPYPVIILIAAFWGALLGWKNREITADTELPGVALGVTLKTVAIWLAIWWLPVLAVSYFLDQQILTDIAMFFSKLAVVTFGGAYAVLAYMGQDVVSQFGWLEPGEMIDGLGLAETTPGPLILVTEFVGYIAAYRQGGILLGLAGAVLTLWVTFVPCFLWIFAGAPYIDWISAQPRLAGALKAITAAVVGVILNLSIWFGLHVLFEDVKKEQVGILTLWNPELNSIDWRVLVLSLLCAILLLRLHWNIVKVLLVSAFSGLMLINLG